jgi:Flp pilus assembly protein TadG
MRNRRNERGSTTTEFVLVVPILAFGMMFLMGLGYTLMAKQNAVVGARAAVFYRASLDEAPDLNALGGTVGDAVSPEREDWDISDLGDAPADPDLHGVGNSNPVGGEGLIEGAVSGIYQMLNHEIQYQASTTPSLGIVPNALNFDGSVRARSIYSLPEGSWTCKQSGGGSYLGVAMSRVGAPGWARSLFDTGCCETYEATR